MSQQKHRITLALGSNFSAEANIEQAKARLMAAFGKLRVSHSLVTPAIGIVSPPFVNCVIMAQSNQDMQNVLHTLKCIEADMGSLPEDRRKGIVKIDIDLLQFDDIRRKEEDWNRDYIQLLINELRHG